MPTYEVTAPNGKKYEVAGRDGATIDELKTSVLAQHPDAGIAKSSKPGPDLAKMSDADLKALAAGNVKAMSTEGLKIVAGVNDKSQSTQLVAPVSTSSPDLQQVLNAMHNAKAMGETVDARRLAEIAQRLIDTGATADGSDLADIRQTLSTTRSVEQKPMHLKDTDLGGAASYAAIQTVAGMAIAVAVFWLLTRKLWKKPRTKPHELGIWLASWVGCLQLGLSVGKFTGNVLYGTVSNNDIYLLAMNGVVVAFIFGLCAYVVGWLFRRFISPTSAPVPIDSHTGLKAASSDVRPNQSRVTNDHFAQALSEIDSEKTDKGLWARCFADANGDDPKAKAAYIKQRANDLSNNA